MRTAGCEMSMSAVGRFDLMARPTPVLLAIRYSAACCLSRSRSMTAYATFDSANSHLADTEARREDVLRFGRCKKLSALFSREDNLVRACWWPQYHVQRPAQFDSCEDVGRLNPSAARPLGHVQRLAVEGNQPRLPQVAHLFIACRPSTILRGVVAVVITAIDRVLLGRPLAHIREEVLEGLPAIAYGDSAPSIVLVRGMTRTLTTLFHITPCTVLWGIVTAVRNIPVHRPQLSMTRWSSQIG